MILGLVAEDFNAKKLVIEHLTKASFNYFSLFSVMGDELKKQGMKADMENFVSLKNNLTEKEGKMFLPLRTLKLLEPGMHHVIDGLYHPEEIECLSSERKKDFLLLKIAGDFSGVSAEKAVEMEDLQQAYYEENKEKSNDCLGMAHQTIEFNGDKEAFLQDVNGVVREFIGNLERPSWDEYYMGITRTVAARSNCIKRKVGAIIVKDKRIISTGYNGTPRGTKNCNEGGCKRCNELTTAGKNLGECTCSHGEENAIVQAAYHGGTSLKDSTIYTLFSPCMNCTKMIINAGIVEVIFTHEYPGFDSARKLLEDAGLKVRQIDN